MEHYPDVRTNNNNNKKHFIISTLLYRSFVQFIKHKKKASQARFQKISKKSYIIIGPDLADFNSLGKTIIPFIERPFLPTEVDKLKDLNKNNQEDTLMTNAILLGPPQRHEGLNEVK